MARRVLVWMVLLLLAGQMAQSTVAADLGRVGESPHSQSGPQQLYLPHVAAGGCPDFADDFSADAGWFTGERDGLLAERHDGEYRLRIDRPGYVWLVGAPGCGRHSYHAAVDARWAGPPGNFYGLLFNIDGELDRAHLLAVNTEARLWLVLELTPDDAAFVVEPARHDAIRPGGEVNRLAAERRGGRVYLSINGAPAGDLPDPSPGRPVLAGLAAATYTGQAPADARFDAFTYRTLLP